MSEHEQTTAEIFAKVAPYLGDGWRSEAVDPHNNTMGGWLYGPDGATLHAYGGYRQGRTDRLAITGYYPGEDHRSYQGRAERFEITVAKDRDPKAIAREIERRLLPGYLPELERVQAAQADAQVAAGKQAAAIARLCDIFPLATATECGVRWYHNGDGVSYGDVNLYHDGSKGSLELKSASFGTLARLFALLAEIREEGLAAEQAEMVRRATTDDD